jgi:hypothetical protein
MWHTDKQEGTMLNSKETDCLKLASREKQDQTGKNTIS